MIRLLPGPVQMAESVTAAFRREAVSHRSPEMVETYKGLRTRLSSLCGGMPVALLTGSGTLANDAIAACLRSRYGDAAGVVLTNGEFGDRLCGQARRAGLRFVTAATEWGKPWDLGAVEEELRRGAAWVWCVHLETSTGRLNDVHGLAEVCKASRAGLYVDCVSSLGAVPLGDVPMEMATGVSGKSLGAYTGVAMVFVSEGALAETRFARLPATFDLGANVRCAEPMFTLASSQVFALEEALRLQYGSNVAAVDRFTHYAELGARVRAEMRCRDLEPLVEDDGAAPVITTFRLRDPGMLLRCERAGYLLAHESAYLRERGWAQIATMGALTWRVLEPLFAELAARG